MMQGSETIMTMEIPDAKNPRVRSVIRELALLLRENGEKVLNGKTKLSLTTAALGCLNAGFSEIVDVDMSRTFDVSQPDNSSWSIHHEIQFLYDFVQKVVSVKISRDAGTLLGNVNISMFRGLQMLELKKVPIHLVVGLQGLRPHLQLIVCHRCVDKVENLFGSCGADRSPSFAWSELKSASLGFNGIESLDGSMKLLPNLTSLDLSHNQISITTGLEYLTQLQHLNLNYNQLHDVPVLSQRAQISLKALCVRNNNLENIEGIERFQKLQYLDVGYNCLLDHCLLQPLMGLLYLKELNLVGNPLHCHAQHRELTIQHLHLLTLPQVVLNEKLITRQEILKCRKKRHICGGCNLFIPMSENISTSTNELAHQIDANGIDDVAYEESIIEIISSDDASSIGDGIQGVSRPEVPSKSRRIRVAREAVINDSLIEPHVIAESYNFNQKQHSNASIGSSGSGMLQAKQEIEEYRRQHGEAWLVVGTKMNILVNPLPEDVMAHNEEEKAFHSKRISQHSDDILVLSRETADSFSSSKVTQERTSTELEDFPKTDCVASPLDFTSAQEEEDELFADLNPFIVLAEKPGKSVSAAVMLVVTNTHLKEKDIFTGITLEQLELCSICTVTALPLQLISEDCNGYKYGLHVTFNYTRKDRRERVYRVEDQESFQSLVSVLQPLADAYTLKLMTVGVLQCLKCSSQFSKGVAKTVFEPHSSLSAEGTPSSVSSFDEAVICPNCCSKMVFELESPMAVNVDKPAIENLSAVNTSTTSASADLKRHLPTCGNGCIEIKVQAEVHHSEDQVVDDETNIEMPVTYPMPSLDSLHRSESEVTIHSNQSQNSIQVVTLSSTELDTNADYNSLNSGITIPTQQLPLPHQNCSLDEREDLSVQQQTMCTNVLTQLSKIESSSSGSFSGSACTAKEYSVYDQTATVNTLEAEAHLQTPLTLQKASSQSNSLSPSRPKQDTVCHLTKSSSDNQFKIVTGGDCVTKYNQVCDTKYDGVSFSYSEFSQVDHRIKLFLDMHVFSVDEVFLGILKTSVVPFGKEEWPGLLVITTTMIHILKIKEKNGLPPENWLNLFESYPFSHLYYVSVLLGNQGFQMEFKGSDVACYTFLLRDADRTNSYMMFLTDALGNSVHCIPTDQIQFELHAEQTLHAIKEQVLPWTPSNYSLVDSHCSKSETQIILYMMGYWRSEGQKIFEQVSIVITPFDIYVIKENVNCMVPHILEPPSQEKCNKQFTPIHRQKIQDLICLEVFEDDSTTLLIKFLDEDTQKELVWMCKAETVSSVNSLVESLKVPWEQMFGVQLLMIVATN